MTSFQQFWLILTDIIGVSSVATALFFFILAIKQWVSRKSFRKIDRELRWSLLPIALMTAVYVLFEKVWVIALRPNGSGEPSFPSTHTMVVATIFFMTIIILPKYVKSRKARLILDVAMLLAIVLVAVGRVLANMHWPTDVLGGVIFAGIFATIYNLILRRPPHEKITKAPKNRPSPEVVQPDSPR